MGLDYKKLGVNVKHYRKECGLTQKQVADIIHITEQHISHIETGRTKASLEVIVDYIFLFKNLEIITPSF